MFLVFYSLVTLCFCIMVVVMKFGGSSVADGERILQVAKLIKAEKGRKQGEWLTQRNLK